MGQLSIRQGVPVLPPKESRNRKRISLIPVSETVQWAILYPLPEWWPWLRGSFRRLAVYPSVGAVQRDLFQQEGCHA
jgi:hypothetical protein